MEAKIANILFDFNGIIIISHIGIDILTTSFTIRIQY
jgi:hypothetical protein